MREDKLAERSMEFAVQIIELTKTLRMRKEFIKMCIRDRLHRMQ